ncbi:MULTISPECIES: ammonia permease [Bacillus]|uniref:ammonia permease n=1 Tax=Bacillus TaxID=1386 RepID=UPI0009959EBD|nr:MULTISPECIES: ammonia permease [Bacillus cereus group]MBJ8019069.1 ammonia permease [Bacillus cereus group sp. N34]OOR35797.1 ammonia permease [Bacillus mycoides]QWH52706.1 ammonia permease [Bacillus mycoides]QWI62515.1 ammonia permease [Bacillus mycoides]QWI99713.1 ammonia permease [Bacillus mycoides]
MFSIIWILFTPLLLLCGIAGGIFLMVTGIKYRKLLVILMGIICFSFVIMPFIFLNKGINGETVLHIPPVLYWILFSLAGLLAGLNGVRSKIKSIRSMGFIIFSIGLFAAICYQLMSMPDSSFIR